MSFYIRNLPSGTRYWEVKSFLRNDCGISTFNVNSLEPDKAATNGSMKVTVDLTDDYNDKIKVMRQISSPYKGKQLTVEGIGGIASNTFSSVNDPTTNYKNSTNSNFGNSNFDQFNYNNQGPKNRKQDNVNTAGYRTLLGERSGNQGGFKEDTSGYNQSGFGYNRNQNVDNVSYDTTSQPRNQAAYDNRPMSNINRPAPNKSTLVNKSYNKTGFNQDSGSFNNAGYNYNQNQNMGFGNQNVASTQKPLYGSALTTNPTQPPSYGQFQRNQPDRQTNIPSLFDSPRPNIAPFGNTRSDRTYHDQAESNWNRNEPQFSQNEGHRSSEPTLVGHGQFSEPPRNIPRTDYYNQPIKSLLKNTFQPHQQGYNTTGFSQPHMGGSNNQASVAPRHPFYGKQNDSLPSKVGDNSPQRSSSRWDSGPEVFERALERYDSEDLYPDNQMQIQRGNNTFSTKRKASPPPLLHYDYTAKNDQPKHSFEKRPFYEINEYTENRQSSGSMGNVRSRSSGSLDNKQSRKERKPRKRPRNRGNKSNANRSSSGGPPMKKNALIMITAKPERFTRPNVERQPLNKSSGYNTLLPKSTFIGKPETYSRANIVKQPPKKLAGNNKFSLLPKSTNIGEPAIFGHPNVSSPCHTISTKEALPFVKPTNISEPPKQAVANKTGNFQIMEGISKTKQNNPQVVESLEKANQGLLNTASYIDFGRDKGVRINAANFLAKEILKEMGFNVQNRINSPKIKKIVEVILVRFDKLFGNTLQLKGKTVVKAYKNAYDGEDIAALMNKAFSAQANEFIDFVGAPDENNDKPKSSTGNDWFDLSTAARKEAVYQEITELTDLFRQELKNREEPDRVMDNHNVFDATVDAFSQVMKHQLEHRLQREVHNFYLKLYVYSGKLLDKAEVMKTLSEHGVIHLLKAEREKMFIAQVDTLENYDKLFQMETITVAGKPLRIEPLYFRVPIKLSSESGPRDQPPPTTKYHNNNKSETTKTVGTKAPKMSKQNEVVVENVNVDTTPKDDTNKMKATNENENVTAVPKDKEALYKKVNLDDSDIQVKDKTVLCVDLTDDLMMESDDFVIDSFGSEMRFDDDDIVQQKLVSADDKNDEEVVESKNDDNVTESKNDEEVVESKNDDNVPESKNDEEVVESQNETEKGEKTENVQKWQRAQSHSEVTPQSVPANEGVRKYANQYERKRAKMQRRAERQRLAQMGQKQKTYKQTKKVHKDQTKSDAVLILDDDDGDGDGNDDDDDEMGPGSEERHIVEPLNFSDDELEDY